jgi:CBS domain-containing protein
MRIREIMSTPVETVHPEMSLKEAAQRMRLRGLHHLLVKDAGHVVGIISDEDLQGAEGRANFRAAHVMSPHVVTVEEGDTVRHAANLMQGRNVGCLAVTEQGKLVGIVTVSDLLRLLGKGGERRVAGVRAALHYRTAHRKQKAPQRW